MIFWTSKGIKKCALCENDHIWPVSEPCFRPFDTYYLLNLPSLKTAFLFRLISRDSYIVLFIESSQKSVPNLKSRRLHRGIRRNTTTSKSDVNFARPPRFSFWVIYLMGKGEQKIKECDCSPRPTIFN